MFCFPGNKLILLQLFQTLDAHINIIFIVGNLYCGLLFGRGIGGTIFESCCDIGIDPVFFIQFSVNGDLAHKGIGGYGTEIGDVFIILFDPGLFKKFPHLFYMG